MFENEEKYIEVINNLTHETSAWRQTVNELLQANINFKVAFSIIEKQQEISKSILDAKNKEIDRLLAEINNITQKNVIHSDQNEIDEINEILSDPA